MRLLLAVASAALSGRCTERIITSHCNSDAGSHCNSYRDPTRRRPHYERVGDGDIEVLWQRPLGEIVKGLLFVAHGCNHQATDFFTHIGKDGWELPGCKSSNFGTCLGLPEERQLVQTARKRGYLVVAVSSGFSTCWSFHDTQRVERALRHVLEKEGLSPNSTPVLATGASSGGSFMGPLAEGALRVQLRCVAPQISDADFEAFVPAIFVHMPRDQRTAERVQRRLEELRSRGSRVAELRVEPVAVDVALLSKAVASEQAKALVRALKESGHLDADGLLLRDPRLSNWRGALRTLALALGDSLVADESPIAEMLNVAWAKHELVGRYTDQILDFCEKELV
eukprot:CAMPEP_0171066192 /NCGR_PEP_ID=MMETSP0766_2-20121228/7280_1 /TAXON_ID=439317 /ORGANISM="Gambierdiscus australes, Strain CAWD 149" /LENGTH=339 /DNA_ID=CAMNT_0011522347 /DNA_START=48 /DNA_END=1067 /DNA_ORIENTATION=+